MGAGHTISATNRASSLGICLSLRWVDRACPSTWQARRSETRSAPNLSLTHTTARLLFAGPRSFPRKLPSGSGCPKTDPPPASSTGHSPSPGTSNAWPDPVEDLRTPSATGSRSARSPRSVYTPGLPAVLGLDVHSQDIIHKWKSADRRQTTQALMLAMMIIEVKPGAKPANTVA